MVPVEDHCTCSPGSCGPPPKDKIFVPMVWGYIEDDRPWHDDINDPVAEQYEIVLGFNEPNHENQADIPPEVAASAWIEMQNMYPDKVGRIYFRFEKGIENLSLDFGQSLCCRWWDPPVV